MKRKDLIVMAAIIMFIMGAFIAYQAHDAGAHHIHVDGIECVTFEQGIDCNWNGR